MPSRDLTALLSAPTVLDELREAGPDRRPSIAVEHLIGIATDSFPLDLFTSMPLKATASELGRELTPAEMVSTLVYLAEIARHFARFIPERERRDIIASMLGVFGEVVDGAADRDPRVAEV